MRADQIDGHDVLVIETSIESSAASFSLGDLDLGGEELTEEEAAFMAFFDISMELKPSRTTTEAWFDPEAGLVRKHSGDAGTGFSMSFGSLPDTDGPVGMSMDMVIGFDMAISQL